MLTTLDKFPAPYFGGKRFAAPAIWSALGDVLHYVEPFCGSCSVLLCRPHPCNRTYHSETVNDADGLLVNAIRALQLSPDATAEASSWPVSECDLHARHLAILRWAADKNFERLMGDPAWHDPLMAGWWLWGQSCWIGSGWCSGRGPWIVGADGRITKRERPAAGPGVERKRPQLTDDGRGLNHAGAREPGVARNLPHLAGDGQGVNRPQAREPGVERKRPHLGDNGQGVNHAGTREPGVERKRPDIAQNGRGVNHAGTREPGVERKRPDIAQDGRGVNHAGTREPGVNRKRPHLGDNGRGVNHAGAREPGVADEDGWPEYHPMTMPELRRWFAFLSARLRHVRILCGDWTRAVTSGATLSISVRKGDGPCGVFLDPPYSDAAGRRDGLYTVDCEQVAHNVRAWCLEQGPDPRYRIVLAGFEGEGHEALEEAGWRSVEWFKKGFLRGGMGNTAIRDEDDADGPTHQQVRERLWLSPHCLDAAEVPKSSNGRVAPGQTSIDWGSAS